MSNLNPFDLLSLLPKVYQKIVDYIEIYKAVQPEVDDMKSLSSNSWLNLFIQTCDVDMLKKFETLCNITPADDMNIEDRRMQVLSVYASVLPFTLPKLYETLNSFLGPENYKLDSSRFKEYILSIDVSERANTAFERVVTFLIPYIPSHIQWHATKTIIVEPENNQPIYVAGYLENWWTIEINDERMDWNLKMNIENSIYYGGVPSQVRTETLTMQRFTLNDVTTNKLPADNLTYTKDEEENKNG